MNQQGQLKLVTMAQQREAKRQTVVPAHGATTVCYSGDPLASACRTRDSTELETELWPVPGALLWASGAAPPGF